MTKKFQPKSSGHRKISIKLKTARGRTNSSQRWLQRHLNDPYVQRARAEGYRSRAAYKLLEINDKFPLLKKGLTVVDLGAAPGGWTQVLLKLLGVENQEKTGIIALDILEMEPLAGVHVIHGDFTERETLDNLLAYTEEGVDVVLSDMAPASTGHKKTDHIRIMDLVEQAAYFAADVLKPGGAFVAKTLQGGGQDDVLQLLKKLFSKVSHYKPPSSRKESSEMYVVARGFKGKPENLYEDV